MRKLVLPLLLGALLGPATARATEVTVYDGHEAVQRDDPFLPAWDVTDGPAACRRPASGVRPPAFPSKGPSVRKAVRDAYVKGAITKEQHDLWRADYLAARSARKRLKGGRRAELHSVIATLERIAAQGSLTASRMPALFLQLERNTEWWTGRASTRSARAAQVPSGGPCPAGGGGGGGTSSRVVFKGSQLVFQHYAGEGLQIQPLANFGRANALYNACSAETPDPKFPCKREELQQLLDELLAIRTRRGSFYTWEYYFAFGGGRPPWTSGLSQGTAIQAFSRASVLFARPDYLAVAKDALGAFETSPPVGVRVRADGGNHYLIYSFNPGLRVLNAFIQSLNGLHDYAQISADPVALELFEAGDRAAQAELPRFDTGAWSLYNMRGRESTLSYHRLVRDFLKGLCTRTATPAYCETADRFTRYLSERTNVELLGPAKTRQRRATPLRFRISKASCVWLLVKRSGKVAYGRRLLLGYGTRTLTWKPAKPGTYDIRLEAIDFRNHHTVATSQIEVLRKKRR
jgi:hypothetical protein